MTNDLKYDFKPLEFSLTKLKGGREITLYPFESWELACWKLNLKSFLNSWGKEK